MISPQQIIEGMADKNRMLTQKNDEYIELSEKRAQAERAYSMAVAKETLKQKAEGQSITIIDNSNPAPADPTRKEGRTGTEI